MSKIIFRADGNSQIGLGHVIRSLALADMLKADFDCHFVIRNPLPILKTQILGICSSVIELEETSNDEYEAAQFVDKYLTGNEIVVLDGYHFKTGYQQIIKDKGCKVVCIDDIHDCHYVADMVINHAGGLTKQDYSAEPYTKFCLGLKYALLREPFRRAAKDRTYPHRQSNSVFICLGGADPNNDTLKILQKCERDPTIDKVYLVIGGAYQYRNTLEAYLAESSLDVTLLSNLAAKDMVEYMKRCGKAITPPSTISYEYLSVGGELYLQIIADNQININNYFVEEKLAFPIDYFPIKENSLVEASLKKQAVQLDGSADQRFIEIFNSI